MLCPYHAIVGTVDFNKHFEWCRSAACCVLAHAAMWPVPLTHNYRLIQGI